MIIDVWNPLIQTLKKELVNHVQYDTFRNAKLSLFEFIEGYK